MGIPKQVKMGGRTLTVRLVPGLRQATGDQDGATDDEWICIGPERRPAWTMVHELIHQTGWQIGVSVAERTVKQVEQVLLALIVDNPDLVLWLIAEIADVAHCAKRAASSKRKKK